MLRGPQFLSKETPRASLKESPRANLEGPRVNFMVVAQCWFQGPQEGISGALES